MQRSETTSIDARTDAELEALGPEAWARVAERVKAACADAAARAGADASIAGLCLEGALEAAVGAIQMLDAEALRRAVLERRGE